MSVSVIVSVLISHNNAMYNSFASDYVPVFVRFPQSHLSNSIK